MMMFLLAEDNFPIAKLEKATFSTTKDLHYVFHSFDMSAEDDMFLYTKQSGKG
jgi:hypothetical protein